MKTTSKGERGDSNRRPQVCWTNALPIYLLLTLLYTFSGFANISVREFKLFVHFFYLLLFFVTIIYIVTTDSITYILFLLLEVLLNLENYSIPRKDSTSAAICTFVNRIPTITLNVLCAVGVHGHTDIYLLVNLLGLRETNLTIALTIISPFIFA